MVGEVHMGIGKRAFLYVTRKRMRSILLFLLFFASGLFFLMGLSIKQVAKKAAEDFQKTLTTGLRIEGKMVDPSSLWNISKNEKGEDIIRYHAPLMMEEHIEEFLAIEGVKGFYSEDMACLSAYTGLSLRPGYYSWCQNVAHENVPLEGDITKEFQDYLIEESYNADKVKAQSNGFLGVYDSEWHPAFINGAVELVEGRHIRIGDKAKAVISDKLAENNNLKLGDKIKAQNTDIFTGEFYGSIYETEIVGIFHINFEQPITPDKTLEWDILENSVFCTPEFDFWSRHEGQLHKDMPVTAEESDKRLYTVVLFLEEPALLDNVKEKLLAMDSIDWNYYDMGTYDKDYQTAAAPLLSMMRISDLLAVIPAIGTLAILSLVLMIWMRSRSYEIGILSSIGIKKKTILLQFFTECCGIAAAAFLAALLCSGSAIKLAGDALQAQLYSSGFEEKYEVVVQLETSQMDINLLPQAKGDALDYPVTPGEACFVFLILTGTAAITSVLSSGRMIGQRPWEVLHRK